MEWYLWVTLTCLYLMVGFGAFVGHLELRKCGAVDKKISWPVVLIWPMMIGIAVVYFAFYFEESNLDQHKSSSAE